MNRQSMRLPRLAALTAHCALPHTYLPPYRQHGARGEQHRRMGACAAKPQRSPAQPEGARDRSPSDVAASVLAQKVSTNVDPVMLRTRGATKKDVLDQRRTATEELSSLRNTSDDSSAVVAQLRSSRLALGPARSEGSLSRRMSRISTMGRRQIVEGIRAAADSHGGQGSGLGRRLGSLGLSSLEMEGDGNCQVR